MISSLGNQCWVWRCKFLKIDQHFAEVMGENQVSCFFLLTGYNTTTGRTDGRTVTDRQKCNTNIALCMLLLADFRQISFNKLQSALDIQSWSWVGSIHGLGWVGRRLDGVIFLASRKTLLSVNEYCSWIITFIDSRLAECTLYSQQAEYRVGPRLFTYFYL